MKWCKYHKSEVISSIEEWCRETEDKIGVPCLCDTCEYCEERDFKTYSKYEDVLFDIIVDYGQKDDPLTYCIYNDSEKSLQYGGKQLSRKVYLTDEDYKKFENQVVANGIPRVRLIRKTGEITSLEEFLKETVYKLKISDLLKEFSFLEGNSVQFSTNNWGYACDLSDEDYNQLRLFAIEFERFIMKEHYRRRNIGDAPYFNMKDKDYVYR